MSTNDLLHIGQAYPLQSKVQRIVVVCYPRRTEGLRGIWQRLVYNAIQYHYWDLGFITFYWAEFTVAQRERAHEDFKVPYEGNVQYPSCYKKVTCVQYAWHLLGQRLSTQKKLHWFNLWSFVSVSLNYNWHPFVSTLSSTKPFYNTYKTSHTLSPDTSKNRCCSRNSHLHNTPYIQTVKNN